MTQFPGLKSIAIAFAATALLFQLPACSLPASASNGTQTQIWQEGQQLTPDFAAIQELGQELDLAWDQRDAAHFSSLFLANGSFRFPGGTLLEGRAHIAHYYQTTAFPSFDADLIHRTNPKRIQLLSPEIAIADGLVHFIHTEAINPEDRLDLILFVSSTLVKQNGQWRIAAVRLIPVS
jgi:uncharacterized protein (TIGR02246 family)